MRILKSIRVIGIVAVTAAALLAGCSGGGGEDVASIDKPTAEPEATSDDQTHYDEAQVKSAQALADCLAEEGVKAELLDMGVGGHEDVTYKSVFITLNSPDGYFQMPHAGGSAGPDAPSPGELNLPEDEYVLYDNGRDMSAEFKACVDKSGFSIPEAQFDPREETTEKELQVAANNHWTACARNNGMPELADGTFTIDNFETFPKVAIPSTTSLQLFKQVLAVCRPLDPARDLTVSNVDENALRWTDPLFDFGESNNEAAKALQNALDEETNRLYEEARQ
jgi:hypothetical protein